MKVRIIYYYKELEDKEIQWKAKDKRGNHLFKLMKMWKSRSFSTELHEYCDIDNNQIKLK